MGEPNIVDVIALRPTHSQRDHYYIVVDQPVRYVYTKSLITAEMEQLFARAGQTFFLGRCGDFFDYLAGTGGKGRAFAGTEFDIELDDGSKFHCAGDMWGCGRRKTDPETIQVGVATLAQLENCYVFLGGYIRRETLEAWLATNTPSTDYYKHDLKRKRSPYFTPPKRHRSHAYRLRRAQRRSLSRRNNG